MEEIVRDAFWDKYMPGCCEHLVVRNLRKSEKIVPELCFAAEENGELLGGIWYAKARIRSGLMMKNRDIDLHIYTDTLDAERSLKALSSVIASPKTVKLTYINGSDTEEQCLEWHLHFLDDAGEGWKIDMIQILSGSKYDGFFEDVTEAVADALTPETRERILLLKKECPDDMRICGIEYYKAVIADHVTSWGEFMERRKDNPPEKLLEWKPDGKKY